MASIILAALAAFVVSVVGTPLLIRLLVKKGYGQFIRDEGPSSHQSKSGTPTMGGIVIVGAIVLGYLVAHVVPGSSITASGLLALFLTLGLAFVGFLDDYLKIVKKHNLGLTARLKFGLQIGIGTVFAILALQFPNQAQQTPASTHISILRDTGLDLAFWGPVLGLILFVIWSNLIVAAASNGVNLTDGLDGLAAGASVIVFGSYAAINIFQWAQDCAGNNGAAGCFEVRDPHDLAIVSAAVVGAALGFLWWNTSPAKIFMGDTGSLALGGALAAVAILSRTEILLLLVGGLFVLITLSVILQVGYFKISGGKRIFKMAPLQHHFELKGWAEVTIVVRFWILALLFSTAGLAVFYAGWALAQ